MVLHRAALPLLLLAAPLQAAEPLATPSTNAEMMAIFEADQKDREGSLAIDWSVVGPRDVQRQERTQQLLDAGALNSADDYYHAAFVFQHGAKPEDYLKAHLLAMVAVARGKAEGNWIAAATFDRYLGSIGQPQVLGTQFRIDGTKATQEPYARELIPDSLRKVLGVRTLPQQEVQRLDFERRAKANPLPAQQAPETAVYPPRTFPWRADAGGKPCRPLAGVDALVARADVKWVLVGQMPGTNETPAIFADLACHLSQVRPLAVALPFNSAAQPAVDTFLASDGGEQARSAFLASIIWKAPVKEGFASQASVRLFERLREMRVQGRITAVVLYQAFSFRRGSGAVDIERRFTDTLLAQAPAGSEVLVLTGKFGAMRSVPEGGNPENPPMASLLPAAETVTLDVLGNGGSFWGCERAAECGIKALPRPPSERPRGLTLGDADPLFSGTLSIGAPLSASDPQ